jgi:hypothetical protein
VLRTRGAARKRQCANDHRFDTREVVVVNANTRARAIADLVVIGGMTQKEAAERHGIRADSYVSRCVRRYYPDFNARSHGQRLRYEQKGKA